MKNNPIYNGLNRTGINKQAGVTFARGESFEFKKTDDRREESLIPFEITWGKTPSGSDYIDLTGTKVGLLIVKGWNCHKGRWVCRCSCGFYVYRTSRAIKNNKNDVDACYQCTKLNDAKRKYHFKKTGKWLDKKVVMGIGDK